MHPCLMKYNVHVLIAIFILLMHLSEQSEYTYKKAVQCLAVNIKFFTLLMHPCLTKYSVHV